MPGLGGRGAGIADQAHAIAQGKGIEHAGQDADVGQHAADDQRVDLHGPESGIEVGAVKGTVPALVDDPFTRLRRQRLDDFHLPGAGAVTAGATVGGQGFAGGQVTAVGLIDVAGIDDRHPLMAGGIEQGGGMGDHPVEVLQDETVLLLHVDDQQRVVIVHWANLIKGEYKAPHETRGA
ncbi:hypothetical protein D9M71_685290 [compost metagenome]